MGGMCNCSEEQWLRVARKAGSMKWGSMQAGYLAPAICLASVPPWDPKTRESGQDNIACLIKGRRAVGTR